MHRKETRCRERDWQNSKLDWKGGRKFSPGCTQISNKVDSWMAGLATLRRTVPPDDRSTSKMLSRDSSTCVRSRATCGCSNYRTPTYNGGCWRSVWVDFCAPTLSLRMN